MKRWEPFTASFTGKLTSFTLKDGRTVTIPTNHPSVVKGQPFMVEIDDTSTQFRMLPVLVPPYWIGLRG